MPSPPVHLRLAAATRPQRDAQLAELVALFGARLRVVWLDERPRLLGERWVWAAYCELAAPLASVGEGDVEGLESYRRDE